VITNKNAVSYLNSVVDKCNDLQLDRDKVKRVIRRRGFDTGEWNKITVIRQKQSSILRYETKVYWEGEYLGTLKTIGNELLFNAFDEEVTLH
jgi:hypothetical protein